MRLSSIYKTTEVIFHLTKRFGYFSGPRPEAGGNTDNRANSAQFQLKLPTGAEFGNIVYCYGKEISYFFLPYTSFCLSYILDTFVANKIKLTGAKVKSESFRFVTVYSTFYIYVPSLVYVCVIHAKKCS